ncbi:cytochrome P450 4C1-like [Hydractinia symbiolongicarpus]|uniref:cytochrome P450 4C1-like n=1 Tax=Hydractinia symbiolongicarpus TaxID=13093 RepID=UPI002551BF80|nr:cytochrome P450 4C1-like [Hydractinia symbiolongicarpus]
MIEIIANVFILVLCLYGIIHLAWRVYTSKLKFLPGPSDLPIIGSVLEMEREPHKLFRQLQEYQKQFNYVFKVWLGYVPVVVSGNAEYAEAILSCKDLIKKSTFYWTSFGWLGTGLLTSDGSKWKNRRRLISPTFHFNILNDFVSIFVKHAESLVEALKLKSDADKAIDVQVPISLATLNVICETAMGVKIDIQQSTSAQYVKSVHSMTQHFQTRQKYPWLWPDFIYKLTSAGQEYYKDLKIAHDFTIDVIKKRAQSRNLSSNNIESADNNFKKVFIDMLLDLYDKGEIDIDGIREEVNTFMFAGHDTTATGMGWILYLLGRHPEVQKKLHAEIDRADLIPGIVLDKVRELKYLEYVIKEGLRLHPPIPLIARVLEKDTAIGKHVIPSGTEIALDVYALHLNPEYWDEPKTFNPDRFGQEKFLKRNPYSYIPFSAGSRNCIGQKFAMLEEKVFLFHIMKNFRLTSIQAENEVAECCEIIHKSNNGLMIKFSSR